MPSKFGCDLIVPADLGAVTGKFEHVQRKERPRAGWKILHRT